MSKPKNLTEYLAYKKRKGKPIIIAYLPALYPNKEKSKKWIKMLLDNGVDAVELGYPSKNPEMDGKLISDANKHVYKNGFKEGYYNELAEEIISELEFNRLIAMGYWDQIKEQFFNRFIEEWKEIGLTPLIFPDLNSKKTINELKKNGFDIIPFIENKEKIEKNVPGNEPFIYCPTYLGKTGKSGEFNIDHLQSLKENLDKSNFRDKPHLAGFGISKGEDAKKVIELGYDGIIVGSAFVDRFNKSEKEAITFLEELKTSIGKE